MNFWIFKLDLEKAEEPEIKLPTSVGSLKKQASSRKTSTSALLTMPKPLTVLITHKLWTILKEMGIPDHLTYIQLEPDMEQQTGSKEKDYIKAVYCHRAYLTYMQSTSWEMLDWMKHKLNQGCWRKYQ